MEELIAYVEAKNAETQAWIDAGPNRWASMYSTNPQHWIERGITTVAQLKRDNLETMVYEMTKDAYGYRPSNLHLLSDEELEAEADRLSDTISRQIDEERAQEAKNAERFEARVKEIMELVSGSTREDAIRYIVEAEDMTQDVEWYGYESLEYKFGLQFDYIKNSL